VIRVNCYGVICDIHDETRGAGKTALDSVAHDFAYFVSADHAADPIVKVKLTDVKTTFEGRRIDWPDGTVVFDSAQSDQRNAHIYCGANSADYVINYLQSVIGEILEKRGWFRLHACGHTQGEHVDIWCATSGSGKSWRALHILKNSGEKILGDEILYFYQGKVYPFPIPIATSTKTGESKRQRHFLGSNKYLTTIPCERVSPPRSDFTVHYLMKPCRLRFTFEVVLGLGLPQMYKYLVRRNNVLWLASLALRRLRFAIGLWPKLHAASLKELRYQP
jgi:hypothetical protein